METSILTRVAVAAVFVASPLFLAPAAAQADQASDAFRQVGHGYPALRTPLPLRPAGDFGFYYRDRDGFFFGYDPRDHRRWYRDWRRQYYYERYFDHRKRRWLHDRRHYRDWYRRHYRDHYRDRYRDRYQDRYRDYDHDHRRRGRGRD